LTAKGFEEWRAQNANEVLGKAKKILRRLHKPAEQLRQTHPRLLYAISDQSSWHDVEEMQNMWAGLLVSAALTHAYDESNLVFVGILSKMTAGEVRILNYACANAPKVVAEDGIVVAEQLACSISELMRIAHITEVFCLDFQIDHLRAMGLLPYGINLHETTQQLVADITPSSLALYMFVRCNGFPGSPADYFLHNQGNLHVNANHPDV